jgi:DNA (cytosine-5)-methyltransferase 1
MPNYYNEYEPHAVQWLRNLIDAGLLPKGDVDERSITDVTAGDLAGYSQCHFFAGIGGWSVALKLAGVPDDYPLWTGSCPCQPFSAAPGERKGTDDARHLWPVWDKLIRQCRPPVIFGEQVENAIRYGWLDLVSADLENQGYAVGAAILGACSVGAPHRRQRLYWVADSQRVPAQLLREPGRVAGEAGTTEEGREVNVRDQLGSGSEVRFWDDIIWIECRDGCKRPCQPGLSPLADGVPGRLDKLRAYGNALVPQVAAAFLKSVL